ncbi:MAG: hypothetical protein AB1489_04630 [Acidobacteriota bacterium]
MFKPSIKDTSLLTLPQSIRGLFSAWLVLWLAGLTCMVCCERIVLAESTSSVSNKCQLASPSGSSCCQKSREKQEKKLSLAGAIDSTSAPLPAPVQSGCCLYPCSPMDLSRSVRNAQAQVDVSEVDVKAPLSLPQHIPIREILPQLLPDRSDTHLRCCVLLI